MFSLLRRINVNQLSKQLVAIESAAYKNHQQSLKKTISILCLPCSTDTEVSWQLMESIVQQLARELSSLNYQLPLLARPIVSKDECIEFMDAFPDLIGFLTASASEYDSNSRDAANWYAKALQYNVPRGKQNKGLVTVLTYKQMANKSQLTPANIKLAQYLGWCVEMMASVFLVTNDIMDGSVTRRGQPCWHRLEEVGTLAINDSSLIEKGIYKILKQYFGEKDKHIQLLDLFTEASFITLLGQSQDVQTSKGNSTSFTMDKYKAIVANKTSYYTFYFPVSLAMYLCGFTDPEVYGQTKAILLDIGHFFQVQDDFNDCFGNTEITGTIGTDIQKNKCSWLAVVCMEKASEGQKEIMRECYGKTDPIKVAQVKRLYEELDLPNLYAVYQEEIYNKIKTHTQQISKDLPHLNSAFSPFFSTKTRTELFGSCNTSV